MELNEFVDELELLEGFEWEKEYGSIRGLKGKQLFCPITAFAYVRLGQFFNITEPTAAAKALGLDIMYAATIVEASDAESADNLPPHTKLMRKLLEQVLFNESE